MLVQDGAGALYLDLGHRPAPGRHERRLRRRTRRRAANQVADVLRPRTSARRGRRPRTVAAPANARAFWPWAVAGDAGKVSVVWYQTDKVADLDVPARGAARDGGDDDAAPSSAHAQGADRRRRRPADRQQQHLPERHDVRRDRRGPPPRRLLHQRRRRARLRARRDRRHDAARPGHRRRALDVACRCSSGRPPGRAWSARATARPSGAPPAPSRACSGRPRRASGAGTSRLRPGTTRMRSVRVLR